MTFTNVVFVLMALLSCMTFASYPEPGQSQMLDFLNTTVHHPHKRWYGVQTVENGRIKGSFGPWPEKCDARPIRYCFSDARSQKNLEKIVNAAVAGWSHATMVSTMSIIPDNPDELVCSDKDPELGIDALVILDATRDGDGDYNWSKCNTESDTTGYDYAHMNQRGRHKITFCHLIPGEEDKTEAKAVKAMMHELGHVAGLNHEHQRPERDTFIDFHCDRLDGYGKALKDIETDEYAIFEDNIADAQRIKLLCTDDKAAATYLPAALAFLKPENILPVEANKAERRKWKAYAYSKAFDYESIMIYDSYSSSPSGTDLNDKNKWVITRKDGSAILQGGSTGPAKVKISEGDVARIAQLYPKPVDGSEDAMKLDQWAPAIGRKLRVKIRGYQFIVEPPSKLEGV